MSYTAKQKITVWFASAAAVLVFGGCGVSAKAGKYNLPTYDFDPDAQKFVLRTETTADGRKVAVSEASAIYGGFNYPNVITINKPKSKRTQRIDLHMKEGKVINPDDAIPDTFKYKYNYTGCDGKPRTKIIEVPVSQEIKDIIRAKQQKQQSLTLPQYIEVTETREGGHDIVATDSDAKVLAGFFNGILRDALAYFSYGAFGSGGDINNIWRNNNDLFQQQCQEQQQKQQQNQQQDQKQKTNIGISNNIPGRKGNSCGGEEWHNQWHNQWYNSYRGGKGQGSFHHKKPSSSGPRPNF